MRQFAVLVHEGDPVFLVRPSPTKAFIVEADTERKAMNVVKRHFEQSPSLGEVQILSAVDVELLPRHVYAEVRKTEPKREPVHVYAEVQK